MPRFEMHNAAKKAEVEARETKRGSGAKRLGVVRSEPRVVFHEPGVEEEEQRIREQIKQIGRSEYIKQAETALTNAKKFFNGKGGEKEEVLSELQRASEALEGERAEKLAEGGSGNKDLLNKNYDLQADIADWAEKISNSEQSNTKTLEGYQAQKQKEYKAAQKLSANYAKQIKQILGVDPEEISTLSGWKRAKLAVQDVFNGNLVSKWRDAMQKEDALSSEVQTYGAERHGFVAPTEESMQRARGGRRVLTLGEEIPEEESEADQNKRETDARVAKIAWAATMLSSQKADQIYQEAYSRMPKQNDPSDREDVATEYVFRIAEMMEANKAPVNAELVKTLGKEIKKMNKEIGFPEDYSPLKESLPGKHEDIELGGIFEVPKKAKLAGVFDSSEVIPAQIKEDQEERERKELHEELSMSVARAAGVLPNASGIWKLADTQLKSHKAAGKTLDEQYPHLVQENPATKYVFVVAKYLEAIRSEDENRIAEARSVFNMMNGILGIDEKDAALPVEIVNKKSTSRRDQSRAMEDLQAKRNRNQRRSTNV